MMENTLFLNTHHFSQLPKDIPDFPPPKLWSGTCITQRSARQDMDDQDLDMDQKCANLNDMTETDIF